MVLYPIAACLTVLDSCNVALVVTIFSTGTRSGLFIGYLYDSQIIM